MYVNVYVDEETFRNFLNNYGSFDVCLKPEKHSKICLTVPIESVYHHYEPGMAIVVRRKQ